jgi:hypothetical protein
MEPPQRGSGGEVASGGLEPPRRGSDGEVASDSGSGGFEPAGGGSEDLAVRSPPAASNAAAAGSMVAAPPGSSVGRPDPDNYGGPWMWARRTHGWAQRAFPRVYLFLFFNRFTEAGIQLPQKMPHLP